MDRLYKALENYSKSDYYPFHMPGHKRNHSVINENFPIETDITEIEGFDNLHHAEGILKEAQKTVSRIYGTKESFYSVNGSTAALLSAVSAAVPRGGRILMARNCHKAVYHAVYLRNLIPSYIYPQVDEKWWINGGILPDKVERLLAENPDYSAVLITSPSYDGVVSDIAKIADITHRYGIPLIVDEAHGAHFHFSNYFPVSAADLGADLVIQSLHKTLPSMTQTAVLHNCSDRVDSNLIRRFMGIYQSSSPSYVLMASMDSCMEKMQTEGQQMFREFTKMLERTRRRLSVCKYVRLVTPEKGETGIFDYDRSKLVFSTRYASITGTELYHILLDRYHIQMEMESEHYVLAIATVGDTEEGFERLCEAIEEIDREEASGEKNGELQGQEEKAVYPVMNQAMLISEAMEMPAEARPLEECAGKISAEFVYLYPPGIPLIVPGEQITGQLIKKIKIYKEKGLDLQGLEDYTGNMIRIVQKECRHDHSEEQNI